jgi:hypothetical protein
MCGVSFFARASSSLLGRLVNTTNYELQHELLEILFNTRPTEASEVPHLLVHVNCVRARCEVAAFHEVVVELEVLKLMPIHSTR